MGEDGHVCQLTDVKRWLEESYLRHEDDLDDFDETPRINGKFRISKLDEMRPRIDAVADPLERDDRGVDLSAYWYYIKTFGRVGFTLWMVLITTTVALSILPGSCDTNNTHRFTTSS